MYILHLALKIVIITSGPRFFTKGRIAGRGEIFMGEKLMSYLTVLAASKPIRAVTGRITGTVKTFNRIRLMV